MFRLLQCKTRFAFSRNMLAFHVVCYRYVASKEWQGVYRVAVLFVDGRKKKKVGEEETIRLSEFELSWSAASFLFLLPGLTWFMGQALQSVGWPGRWALYSFVYDNWCACTKPYRRSRAGRSSADLSCPHNEQCNFYMNWKCDSHTGALFL